MSCVGFGALRHEDVKGTAAAASCPAQTVRALRDSVCPRRSTLFAQENMLPSRRAKQEVYLVRFASLMRMGFQASAPLPSLPSASVVITNIHPLTEPTCTKPEGGWICSECTAQINYCAHGTHSSKFRKHAAGGVNFVLTPSTISAHVPQPCGHHMICEPTLLSGLASKGAIQLRRTTRRALVVQDTEVDTSDSTTSATCLCTCPWQNVRRTSCSTLGCRSPAVMGRRS